MTLSPDSVESTQAEPEQAAIDERWMRLALEQAEIAARQQEVPVGAVLVAKNELLAAAHNQPIVTRDATAHAEIQAIRQASQIKSNYRLPGTTLYVTIEPCTMCVGALVHARIDRVVFGAREPRAGALVSRFSLLDGDNYNHRVSYAEGILAEQCGQLMEEFFTARRKG